MLNINESLNNPDVQLFDLLKEYVAALMYQNHIYSIHEKDNHCIELYGTKEKIYEVLTNRDNLIYFKINDDNSLIPISRKTKILQSIKNLPYNKKLFLKINDRYNTENINALIKEYKLPKSYMKLVKNGKVCYINKEMILANKLFNLMTNKSQDQMDDLLEVILLYEQEVRLNEIKKWLFVKFENYAYHKLDKEAAILYLQYNKDVEFKYTDENWKSANQKHKTYFSYQDARFIFKKIINKIIE